MENLSMNKGDGEFSYANNSAFQKDVFSRVNKPLLKSAMKSYMSNHVGKPCKVFKVADLGCGVGSVPLELISLVVETIHHEVMLDDEEVPEIQIYMNDLLGNDFNALFENLGKLQLHGGMAYVMGVPGSFYGRLFPRNDLHLVHSNFCLHWLSQVPPSIYNTEGVSMNKSNITLSETSPSSVIDAYRSQFKQDFKMFLCCRGCEMVPGGYMVLTLKGSPSSKVPVMNASHLYQAIKNLVSKGLIRQSKLDSFAMPLYFPPQEEIQELVIEEGSFMIEKLDKDTKSFEAEIEEKRTRAKTVAKLVRALSESMVAYHFGQDICDQLYDELIEVNLSNLEAGKAITTAINFTIVLKKKIAESIA